MYPISALYENYLRRHDVEYVVKVEINGVEYDDSKIVDFVVDNSISNMDELEIGTAIPSMLTLTLRTNEAIPPNARIIPYVALTMEGVTWQDADMSWEDAVFPWEGGNLDWLPLGEFYVDTRERIHDVWTYTCLDKLVFADVPYVSQLNYPANMKTVWDEICDRLDYEYDDSVVIAPYTVPVAPTGYSMRQVLGFIAGANSASVFVGKDGILRFKTYNASDMPQFDFSESDYMRVKQTNPVKSYTRVVVIYDVDDGLYYEAGTGDDSQTLYVENPLGTQQITDDLYAKLNGFSYQPIEMDSKGYPQLDQGDVISFEQTESISWQDADMLWEDADFPWDGVSTHQSIILRQAFGFSGGLKMTLDAPSMSEQQSEFQVEGELSQQVNRLNKDAVKQDRTYYGFTISHEYGAKVERSDGLASAVWNSDELRFIADGEDALWFDVPSKRFKFTGTLEAVDGVFSGDLSAAGGTFTGTLVGVDGTFSGTITASNIIGGFISGTNIIGGTITIGSGNNVFKADENGIWLGHSSFSNAPFRVSPNGFMSVTGAHLSGGNITGATDINVSRDLFAGSNVTALNKFILSNLNFGNGIRWGSSPGFDIYIDPAGGGMYLSSPAGIYANGIRIDVP